MNNDIVTSTDDIWAKDVCNVYMITYQEDLLFIIATILNYK